LAADILNAAARGEALRRGRQQKANTMCHSASALVARLDPAIWLVTAQAGSRRGGLIATFVNPASIVPELPRVVVGLAKQHYTWQLVEAGGSFALHLLGERHIDLVWRFGLSSARQTDKFSGLTVLPGVTASPLLADVLGWMQCKVESKLDTGDRTLYLAEVIGGQLESDDPPLTVSRMVELAPPDRRAELKRRMEFDAAVDAAAIRAWRQAR
jgi:flavin reductase (DIM6/NTAB) family NADH-FMN oxidoreductase RutF